MGWIILAVSGAVTGARFQYSPTPFFRDSNASLTLQRTVHPPRITNQALAEKWIRSQHIYSAISAPSEVIHITLVSSLLGAM